MPRLSDSFLKQDRIETATAWKPLGGALFLIGSIGREGMSEFFTLPPEEQTNDKYIDAIAKHILLDWKNLQEDDGKTEMPCTFENKVRILKLYPSFRNRLMGLAAEQQNFVAANFEEELGNSQSSSDGSASGESI